MKIEQQFHRHSYILAHVIELVASEMGEDPHRRPSDERRIIHCQIAMAFLFEATGEEPDKVIPLVEALLKVPHRPIAYTDERRGH
jgi:hypothetical protein